MSATQHDSVSDILFGAGDSEGGEVVEREERAEPLQAQDFSNNDIMRMLMNMNKELNEKLDSHGHTVDKLVSEVFELQQENRQLTETITLLEQKQEDTESRLNEALHMSKLAFEQANKNEQYSRRNNVKLLFVEEEEGKGETAEQSEEKALDIFSQKLGLSITPNDIEIAHRIGQKGGKGPRPIIVKFVSRRTKHMIIQNRRKLKGKKPGIVIIEDLSKETYILYKRVSDHPASVKSWTSEGRLFAQCADDKIHLIERHSDIENKLGMKGLSSSGTPLSSSTPNDTQQSPSSRKNRH